MKIKILFKNITPDEALKTFIGDKIGGLDKIIGHDESTARVEIGMPSKHHRSGRIYYAEVNLKIGGRLLRASCQHEDLRNAIIYTKRELKKQIENFKSALLKTEKMSKLFI